MPDRETPERLVAEQLEKTPGASLRELSRILGISTQRIRETQAWGLRMRNFNELRTKLRGSSVRAASAGKGIERTKARASDDSKILAFLRARREVEQDYVKSCCEGLKKEEKDKFKDEYSKKSDSEKILALYAHFTRNEE
jgi:hypothetical protein